MGLQAVPLYIGESGFQNPVENDRNALEFLYQRTGLIRPGHFVVAPTGTARQVSVSSGGAVLLGADSSTQGAYLVWSDATDNYTFAAAVGNPRIDTLVMRAVDKQYGSDPGISRAEIEIVQGVAASSPVARADSYFNTGGAAYKPGAWYRLADVRINVVDGVLPAGQITQTKQYVRVGGRNICTSTTRPTDPQPGDEVYETDTDLVRVYNGSGWRNVAGQYIGETTVTSGDIVQTAGGNSVLTSLTFTAVAGARYEVVFESTFKYATGSFTILTLRHASGSSVTTSSTGVGARELAVLGSNAVPVTFTRSFVAAASGTYTVGISAAFYSGSGNLTWAANGNSEMKLMVKEVA
jgi:hypothetical protein